MPNMIWGELHHPFIQDGYLISPYGDIRSVFSQDTQSYKPAYHSSNGYDYAEFIVKEKFRYKHAARRLFPIDEIIAMIFLPVPDELNNKPVTVKHINGDTRDISLDNLEWVEDIEEWRKVTFDGIKPDTYEVSNHGNIRIINSEETVDSNNHNMGYIVWSLQGTNGKKVQVLSHRLVAHAFCPHEDPSALQVNHIDGFRNHNFFKNIEWVTQQQGSAHAYSMDIATRNSEPCKGVGATRLTEDDVRIICKELVRHWGSVKNTVEYLRSQGIPATIDIVNHIKRKVNWKRISDDYFSKADMEDMTERKVFLISRTLKKNNCDVNKTFDDLVDCIPGLTLSFVRSIRNKSSYREISDKYF